MSSENSTAVNDAIVIDRLPAVCETLGLSAATVRRRMASDKSFPRPRRLGTAANSPLGWYRRDIQKWLAQLPAA